MKDKIDIRKLNAFELDNYQNIDLNSLAVYAIYFLQENKIPTTIEIIVVTLFRFFPKKFSLEGYEEYPDSARVNRALLQLRPKYRNWAHGDVQLGYTLNEEGRTQLEKVKILLKKKHLQEPMKSKTRQRTLSPEAEIIHIENSKIFRLYKEDKVDCINDRDVYAFFKAYSYTPARVLRNFINKLKGHARYNERDDIIEFFNWLEKKFSHIFKV